MVAQSIKFPRGMGREGQIRRLAAICLALPPEKAWKVTIEEEAPRRSDSQNALLWALYGQILDRGGEDMRGWVKEDLHDFFLGEHFGWERLDSDLINRAKLKPVKRSSKLSKIEFADFTDHIVHFMAERGVVLDMPGDA